MCRQCFCNEVIPYYKAAHTLHTQTHAAHTLLTNTYCAPAHYTQHRLSLSPSLPPSLSQTDRQTLLTCWSPIHGGRANRLGLECLRGGGLAVSSFPSSAVEHFQVSFCPLSSATHMSLLPVFVLCSYELRIFLWPSFSTSLGMCIDRDMSTDSRRQCIHLDDANRGASRVIVAEIDS